MSLRIVFMGTPRFAVASLERLHHSEHEIAAVVTAPDKAGGRGNQLLESEVKQYASREGLTLLQPTNLKSPDFITALQQLKADVQVVVAFRMLPKAVWAMPPRGTFNLHASLLPQYRGAAPINWAIIGGERQTGVTTFYIDENIDTGPLLMQEKVPITATENAGALHDKLMSTGAELVLKTVDSIERKTLDPKTQAIAETLHSAPKLNRANRRLDWHDTTEHTYDKIRGLSPYPTAWSTLTDGHTRQTVKIYQAAISPQSKISSPGTIALEKKTIRVATRDGWLSILSLQAAGKRKMNAAAFLNGAHLNEDAYFE